MLRYLRTRGVRSLDGVTDALADYEGDPVVERVRETGAVHPDTGPVESLPGDTDPLATAEEREGTDVDVGAEPVEPSE